MSVWEECPLDETPRDDELARQSRHLLAAAREMRLHDRRGFFADFAGDPACMAMGHAPDPEEGWDDDEDEHPIGWDGDRICIATRHGSACTRCESDDCDYPPIDRNAFWALFGKVAA